MSLKMKCKICRIVLLNIFVGVFVSHAGLGATQVAHAADASRNFGLKLNCGAPYGGIWLDTANTDFSTSDVNQMLDQIYWIDSEFSFWDYDGNNIQTTIRQQIINALHTPADVFGGDNIHTPIGSEVAVGEALVDLGLASGYEGLREGCGGAQVSYFTVSKNIGDLKQADLFESYLDQKMSQFTAQLPSESISIETHDIIVPDIPPNFGIKPFFVKAPSGVISDNLSKYTWLRFDLIFNMYSETDKYFIVAVFAENSAQAPKVIRDTPPSDNHFRSFSFDERYAVEDDIAAHIARFISGGDENCYVGDTATNHYSWMYGDEVDIFDAACSKDVLEDFG